MGYSLDLRKRVVGAVKNGQRVSQVSSLFHVSRATIYRWLSRPVLAETKVTTRRRKLDSEELLEHVRQYPEARLKERAAHFQVHPSAIAKRLVKLGVTRKKTVSLSAASAFSSGAISQRAASAVERARC